MSSQTINIITFEQKVEYTKRKILVVSKVNKNRRIRKKVQHSKKNTCQHNQVQFTALQRDEPFIIVHFSRLITMNRAKFCFHCLLAI